MQYKSKIIDENLLTFLLVGLIVYLIISDYNHVEKFEPTNTYLPYYPYYPLANNGVEEEIYNEDDYVFSDESTNRRPIINQELVLFEKTPYLLDHGSNCSPSNIVYMQ